jgi:hypothetical protein
MFTTYIPGVTNPRMTIPVMALHATDRRGARAHHR